MPPTTSTSTIATTSTSTSIVPPPRDDEQGGKVFTLRSPGRSPGRGSGGSGAASSSSPGAARNRRRSLSHVALLDIQTTLPPIPSTPAVHAAHARSASLSLPHPADADTLLPTLSAQSAFDAYSPDRPYQPGQPKSLAGIALRAFCLGAALAVGVVGTLLAALVLGSPLWRLPFFLAALATFHFLEFWTTAAYNTREADVSSFLLTANWPAYAIAHAAASLECLATTLLFPAWRSSSSSWWWWCGGGGALATALGLALVVVGQTVRSAAMVQAGPSFNHIVQQTQKREHLLITTGIYAKLRHPSYFGFFWWSLGTQLVMGNVVCLVGYAAVLWRFFSSRIRHEELFLVKFFGDEYVDYRKRVGTKIPFVP